MAARTEGFHRMVASIHLSAVFSFIIIMWRERERRFIRSCVVVVVAAFTSICGPLSRRARALHLSASPLAINLPAPLSSPSVCDPDGEHTPTHSQTHIHTITRIINGCEAKATEVEWKRFGGFGANVNCFALYCDFFVAFAITRCFSARTSPTLAHSLPLYYLVAKDPRRMCVCAGQTNCVKTTYATHTHTHKGI